MQFGREMVEYFELLFFFCPYFLQLGYFHTLVKIDIQALCLCCVALRPTIKRQTLWSRGLPFQMAATVLICACVCAACQLSSISSHIILPGGQQALQSFLKRIILQMAQLKRELERYTIHNTYWFNQHGQPYSFHLYSPYSSHAVLSSFYILLFTTSSPSCWVTQYC